MQHQYEDVELIPSAENRRFPFDEGRWLGIRLFHTLRFLLKNNRKPQIDVAFNTS